MKQFLSDIYLSECKEFIAFGGPCCNFDVLSKDGNIYFSQSLAFGGVSYKYPLHRCVGGFSNKSKTDREFIFELSLLECDPEIVVKAGTGNTIKKSIDVIFKKKVHFRRIPKWARAFSDQLRDFRNFYYSESEQEK